MLIFYGVVEIERWSELSFFVGMFFKRDGQRVRKFYQWEILKQIIEVGVYGSERLVRLEWMFYSRDVSRLEVFFKRVVYRIYTLVLQRSYYLSVCYLDSRDGEVAIRDRQRIIVALFLICRRREGFLRRERRVIIEKLVLFILGFLGRSQVG